ncbi:MAG: molybdate ABC transporter substrate-binding protein [Pelolinea sp.]|jgi:molybdate transport system substrate-binding protein|nr:molybdate ABC transporter substrate-binding protein [Pelolinea sp.]
MRSKVLSICLLFTILMSAACTTQAAATPTEAPTEAPSSTPVEERTLTVMAAASLTESYTEIGALFESQNPGVTVTFNFAGTQALVEQLTQGAEADVFASANTKYMNAAVDAGLVAADTAQTFAYNKLVVIYPKDNPAGIAELKDLAKSGLKLDLADSSVPVGQYSLDFLDKAAADAAYGTAYKDAVLSNVVSYEENVKAVVTKVSLGEADAGIVYLTDVTADAAESVSKLDIPDELNTIATYPVAPLTASKNADLAQAFVNLVLSSEGQTILAKYGFVPATAQ